MRTALVVIPLYIMLAACAQERTLSFDLASIRENKSTPGSAGEDPGTNVPLGPGNLYSSTGGQLNTRNMALIQLIAFAYRMTGSQQNAFFDMLPPWAKEARYDLQARTDKKDVTKDELRLMMRSLLADRLALKVHYESQTASVYAMEFVKPGTLGLRLRLHTGGTCSTDFRGKTEDPTEDGYPTVCGGLVLLPRSTDTHFAIGARDLPITVFTNSLTSWGDLGRPIVNDTGITGNIDFTLNFLSPRMQAVAPRDTDGPDFQEALRKQLGLKLKSRRQAVQMLVLDHIDHLSGN